MASSALDRPAAAPCPLSFDLRKSTQQRLHRRLERESKLFEAALAWTLSSTRRRQKACGQEAKRLDRFREHQARVLASCNP